MQHTNQTGAAEQPWHICLMVTLLALGALARFYGIDDLGLSASELSTLDMCSAGNWFALAERYNDYSGMTPLFPTLLCEVTTLAGSSEFLVRVLSGLCGLGIVYIIYVIGRDFFSPTAGLLAASIVTFDYSLILANRDASVYSLLALLLLTHHYYFCRLFFVSNHTRQEALTLKLDGQHSQLLWHWQPDFPGSARHVAGFWATAILAFYTSPMAALPLILEFIVSASLLKCSSTLANWKRSLRVLWLPVLVSFLPWLPTLHHYTQWALDGYLLGIADLQHWLTQIGYLLPEDTRFQILIVVLALATIIQTILKPTALALFSGALAIYCSLTLAVLEPASSLSFLYVWMLVLLTLVAPLGMLLDRLLPQNLYRLALALLIVTVVITGINSNKKHLLYTRSTDADFRLAVSILQYDQEFMAGRRKVYLSSPLFNHYLKQKGVIRESGQIIDIHHPEPDFHEAAPNTYFYYLEYRPNMQMHSETNASRELKQTYQLHCESRLGKIRVLKFARDNSPASSETGDCQSYLPHMSTLQ